MGVLSPRRVTEEEERDEERAYPEIRVEGLIIRMAPDPKFVVTRGININHTAGHGTSKPIAFTTTSLGKGLDDELNGRIKNMRNTSALALPRAANGSPHSLAAPPTHIG
eukprot:2193025-Pyramimonas_sp.AAC.1